MQEPSNPDPSTSNSAKPGSQPGAISIDVNDDALALAPGTTIAGLLEKLGMQNRRVAVALNRDVVPRGEYGSVTLDQGDRVEILEAVGGG